MAEALMRHHLDVRGVDAHVHSAGTRPWVGGAAPLTVEVLRERGIDPADHDSRELTADLLATADLVIGMTITHVDVAARRLPQARPRTFLVGEVARLGRKVGPRGVDESLAAWVERVDELRAANGGFARPDDEVDDPVGLPINAYRRTADVLDTALLPLAALLAGT